MQFFFTFYEIFLFQHHISIKFHLQHLRSILQFFNLNSFNTEQDGTQYVLFHYILIQYTLIESILHIATHRFLTFAL
jgi:hypothetical protein